MTETPPNRNIAFMTTGVFLVTLAWVLLLTQGLQRGDLDEWVLTFISKDTPWKDLLGNFVTPWSKSMFWFNQIDFSDQITYKRIFNGILLKATEAAFGLEFLPYYVVTKMFFFAGTVSLLFLSLFEITKSVRCAALGTVFYVLIPAHYAHVLWIADPVTIVHFFTMLGILAFFHVAQNLNQNGSLKKLKGPLMLLLFAGWFGIRTKEPALILPITVGFYTLVKLSSWKTQKLKIYCIAAIAALIAFQIPG